jgi:hypothetical protein
VATSLGMQGRYAEAGPLLRRALAVREQSLGPNHPRTATSYSNLAYNLDAQGRHAEAERLWRQAVAAFEVSRLRLAPSGFDRAAAPIQPHKAWTCAWPARARAPTPGRPPRPDWPADCSTTSRFPTPPAPAPTSAGGGPSTWRSWTPCCCRS